MVYLRSYFIGINCFKDSFNVPWFILLLCHHCECLVLLETRTETSRPVLFGTFFFFQYLFFFYSTFFYLKFWVAILWDSTMKYKRIIWVWNPLICEMDRAFAEEGCELNNDRLLVRKQLHDDTGRSFIYYFLHQSCGSNTVKTGCNLPSRHNLHTQPKNSPETA